MKTALRSMRRAVVGSLTFILVSITVVIALAGDNFQLYLPIVHSNQDGPATPTISTPSSTALEPGEGFILNHNAVAQFEQIPNDYIIAASQIRFLFRHASVGNNINSGLDCLMNNFSQRPAHCDRDLPPDQIVFDPKYDRSRWRFEFHSPPPNQNPGWWNKVNYFIERVNSLAANEPYDAVAFKFGYVDGNSGSTLDDVFFTRNAGDGFPGVEDLEALEAAHPNKIFIWWTMGLARASFADSRNFNQQLRAYAGANNKILMDFADIMSHRPDGSPCYDNQNQGIEALCDEYTEETSGGHLNALGKQRMAKAVWVLMARVAGWAGPQSATATPTATRTPTRVASASNTPTATRTRTPSATPTTPTSYQPVTWTNVVNATANGDDLSKTAATSAWDAGANSTQQLTTGNGGMCFRVFSTSGYRMVGLGRGNSNQSYTDVDYGWYLYRDNRLLVFENGLNRGEMGTYAVGDTLEVRVASGAVRYYHNGTLRYTSTVAPVYPLLVDTSLYTVNATVTDVALGAGACPPSSVTPSPTPTRTPTASRTPTPTRTTTATPTRVVTPVVTPTRTQTPITPPTGQGEWPMVAANPERTSWTSAEVSGNLRLEWVRPVEAYISQNTQVIAANGLLYISTARGLYALDAATGNVVWRYDTELPLGNSPTVVNNVVYVGGYDTRLHALDARTGTHLWAFDGAQAGFDTNPLVINGRVFAGNRDGAMYAIGAHGAPNQGQLIWKYQTAGAIHLSAAYKDDVLYFAANDNYGYALNATTGALVWKSQKLPGDGYQSYWPVIYQDKVVFAAASGYRAGMSPGTSSIPDPSGNGYGKIFDLERDEIFAGAGDGTVLGPTVPNQSWSNGKPVIDVARLTNYHEAKPWRRVFVVLNRSNGSEYTFDSDADGVREYIPVAMWGTQSGNRYPPIVGPDGILYQSNIYERAPIPQGMVMGWQLGTRNMSLVGGRGAVDEPQALSFGGNLIYRNICCDRVGNYFDIREQGIRSQDLWTYNNTLDQQAPNYDVMWTGIEPGDSVRLHGNYGTPNGIYHNHGDQNPLVPYQGRVYVHRSNAIVAYGPGQGPGQLPLLEINDVQDPNPGPSLDELRQRLEAEVQEIINAGHLRPGYYNTGQFSNYRELADYFENPGDTLYALARAYPHLSPQLQTQTQTYLRNEFNTYFDPNMYARIGWADGAARDSVPLPPEVEATLPGFPRTTAPGPRWAWPYPQHNFYAMWKYATIFPQDVGRIYQLAKGELQVPVPSMATTDFFMRWPWHLNAYISGYIGFLELQELAGMQTQDAQLRTSVTNELNRLLALRVQIFTKDTYWQDGTGSYHLRTLNISRNFIFLVPELGDYLNQNALARVQEAVAEYNYTAPYWFVSRYNAVPNEGVMQNLYDYHAVFLAKAYILRERRGELGQYLDVAAFERGDLFYIQNLVAAIEAPP